MNREKIIGIVLILIGAFLLARGFDNLTTIPPALDGRLDTGPGYVEGAIVTTILMLGGGLTLAVLGMKRMKKGVKSAPHRRRPKS